MVRAPCCEKMGLKRGPWTAEEDEVLVNFITLYGHGNWRALPKQAGLSRCGKSCRLRWTNYLRPDIKRGNFTREEEDTIINLHQMLGNRWSAIAARLPGRTDNEIKNVWHTHLKKRLTKKQQQTTPATTQISGAEDKPKPETTSKSNTTTTTTSRGDSASTCYHVPTSPQLSSSTEDISSSSTSNDNKMSLVHDNGLVGSSLYNNGFPEIDDSFWSEVFSGDNNNKKSSVGAAVEIPLSPLSSYEMGHGDGNYGMEFWYDMFNESGEMFVSEFS